MMDELPIVTQADRQAMESILWVRTIIDDQEAIAKTFARHRIASNTEAADLISELVKALRGSRLIVKLIADTLHDRFNLVHNPYLESEIREAKQQLEAIDALLAKATQ